MEPVRLLPGEDLRLALASRSSSAFVVAGIGSLVQARLRYAGADAETTIAGPLEILSLSGTLSGSGVHLHMAVADAAGRVYGGHVGEGNLIRTTAEILLMALDEWELTREHDAATGFKELKAVRRK